MIELGKKYQTSDGRAVRILATDVKGTLWPVVGLLAMRCGVEQVKGWTADGRYLDLQDSSSFDLIPVPTKHEGWILVSRDGTIIGADIIYERIAIESQPFKGQTIHKIVWEDN